MSNKTSFNIRGVIVFLGLLGGLFFMFLGFGYKPKVIKETENGLVIETGFTTKTKYFNGH
jgi:hypothetical protein